MKLPWPFRRSTPREKRSSGYESALVEAFENAAATKGTSDATAALETAASAYGRAFAAARVSPGGMRTEWITPAVLNLIGRQLIRRGELLVRLYVARGTVQGAVAGSWYTHGRMHDRATWLYQLTEFGPSGSQIRWEPASAVAHLQYAYDPARPWWGLGPLHVAAAEGRLHGATVKALADETSGPRGYLLPVPQDGEADHLGKLRDRIARLAGGTAVVETTSAGWGEGPQAAPTSDWKAQRVGFNAPDVLRNLRTDSARAVLSACGVPVELVAASEGTGQREAYRRYLFGSILPLARIVERELSDKLETAVSLDFSELMASDLAGRARAFQSMVGAGMALEQAAALSGLTMEDAA